MHKSYINVIISCLLLLSLVGCSKTNLKLPMQEEQPFSSTNSEETISSESIDDNDYNFSMTMLDVGQGLSLLIESDGEYMLYDGGGRNYSSYVVAYLKQHDVNELKYMFTSHYDEDHINGEVGVLKTTKIETVIRPNYEADSKVYQSYINMLADNGANSIYPNVGDTYQLGDSTITILAPSTYDNEDENNNSIAIKINDNDCSFVITGDAEIDEEQEMIDGGLLAPCDVYVVGHHGSSSSTSIDFLEAIKPSYAFISVGSGNPYGHPTSKTMQTLKEHNVKVYRSDIDGEVTVYSNGTTYWFDKSKQSNYTNDSTNVASSDSSNLNDAEYILNKNTMKFHFPSCSQAAQISDKNRVVTKENREELIKQGYSPCGNCKP